LNFKYFRNPNIRNKNLKYLKTLKKEIILLIHEIFIPKDKNIKIIPNIKIKKFIIK
tara:strand:- start:185 stop:352 length:168 start_codon:yes stop_codon:yes gene_type:complete